jgi:hypothetical protein
LLGYKKRGGKKAEGKNIKKNSADQRPCLPWVEGSGAKLKVLLSLKFVFYYENILITLNKI